MTEWDHGEGAKAEAWGAEELRGQTEEENTANWPERSGR